MKTRKIYNLIFILIIAITSCSKSDNEEPTINKEIFLPQISTNYASNLSGTNVTLGGNIIRNGNGKILRKGICWSTSDNPIIATNNFVEDFNDKIGSFSFNITNQLNIDTEYNVRAYCENSKGIVYGSFIRFKTEKSASILNPTDILTTKAKLRGIINQTGNGIIGFVYGTNPNPNINNNYVSKSISGSSEYDITIFNLVPNTTYYVRGTFPNSQGEINYSEQKQFKTTGYFGTAGGYVAYDKGEIIDGWRYLEIHPTTLNYNIANTTGGAWGNTNTFISGTYPLFGKGLENTTIIVNNTTQNNCAAKLCYNLVLNGYSDWFLPSSEELLLISNSLQKANIYVGDFAWTSTQFSTQNAYS